MHRSLLFFVLLFGASISFSQRNQPDFFQGFDTNRVKRDLNRLASPYMEGRETGKRGQKRAAIFLMQELQASGLNPIDSSGYFQKFSIQEVKPSDVRLKIGSHDFQLGEDFNHDVRFSNQRFFFEQLFFSSSLENIPKTQGNSILVLTAVFSQLDESSIIKVKEQGYLGIIILRHDQEDFKSVKRYYHERLLETEKDSLPVLEVTSSGLQLACGFKKKKWKKLIAGGGFIAVTGSFESVALGAVAEGENVLACLPGKTEEAIVMMAHYDHLGFAQNGEIYFGADDNASGSAALLEIARLLNRLIQNGEIQLEKTIVFMWVAGEEKGLLGSSYYTKHPLFDLKKVHAALNVDMIGRCDPAHIGMENYVYVIGSDFISAELHKINEEVNVNEVGLNLDYTYNSKDHPEQLYYRSDHYNFAKENVPSIFYFSGLHEDYHQISDTPEQINYRKLALISRLIFYTGFTLSQKKGPLE